VAYRERGTVSAGGGRSRPPPPPRPPAGGPPPRARGPPPPPPPPGGARGGGAGGGGAGAPHPPPPPARGRGARAPPPARGRGAAAREAAGRGPALAPPWVVIGGRSMGGRIASHVAADGTDVADVRGLLFFAFPLHPAGRPGTERAAHLARIALPMLFVQGSRD